MASLESSFFGPARAKRKGTAKGQRSRTCQIEHKAGSFRPARAQERTGFLEAESIDTVADPLIFLEVRSAAHGGGARLNAQGRNLDQRRDRQHRTRRLHRRASSTQGERLCLQRNS